MLSGSLVLTRVIRTEVQKSSFATTKNLKAELTDLTSSLEANTSLEEESHRAKAELENVWS